MPGRLASFLNKELKIGNYYLGFSLLALSFVFNYVRQKKKLFIIFLSILIILIGFLIGERSNFIKLFIIFFAFYIFFIEKKYTFYFLLIILTLLISLTIFIKTKPINSPIIHRWISITNQIENKENIFSFINSNQYGQHYKTAKKIFIKYPVFGSGLKTFRIESFKIEYEDLTDPMTNWRGATHPHQVHYEILSETGLIGYIIFFSFFSYFVIISINSFIRTKNIYQLSSILFVISAFIPLLPGGSFFSSYGATIFWVNFSVMIFYNRIK
jgi:oligosaccharide repeat unit polymerase